MAHDLTEASTYHATVSVPDGGEPRTAASVEAPLQRLTDRTKYLKSHVDLIEGLQTLNIALKALAYQTGWQFYTGDFGSWVSTTVTGGPFAVFQLDLPTTGRLKAFRIGAMGPSHGTFPPVNRTKFSLRKINITTGVITTVLSNIADSADQATYEAGHLVDLGALDEALTDDYVWQLVPTGESGTNSQFPYKLFGVQIDWQPPVPA